MISFPVKTAENLWPRSRIKNIYMPKHQVPFPYVIYSAIYNKVVHCCHLWRGSCCVCCYGRRYLNYTFVQTLIVKDAWKENIWNRLTNKQTLKDWLTPFNCGRTSPGDLLYIRKWEKNTTGEFILIIPRFHNFALFPAFHFPIK